MRSNFTRRSRTWKLIACTALACLTALAVETSGKADDDQGGCRFFSGPFSSTLVPPPTCTSPVGLCTNGMLQGDFPAQYDFTFATAPTSPGDPNDPTELTYTGHSLVTTAHAGAIQTNDIGVIHISNPAVPSPFATTALIASGTDAFVGATGEFVATGTLDMATGVSTGTYIAQICVPRQGRGHGGY